MFTAWFFEYVITYCSRVVICLQFSFSFFISLSLHAEPIFLSDIHCTGNEYSLEACTSPGFGVVGNCTHDYDVGVVCSDSKCCIQCTQSLMNC